MSGELSYEDLPRRAQERVIRGLIERLASQYAELDLMLPEVVQALFKCDLRTLEAKGLERVEFGARMVRYRRADVERMIKKGGAE